MGAVFSTFFRTPAFLSVVGSTQKPIEAAAAEATEQQNES
jgi:hypothetical protein